MLRKSMAIRRATLNYSRLGAPLPSIEDSMDFNVGAGGGREGRAYLSTRTDYFGEPGHDFRRDGILEKGRFLTNSRSKLFN